MLIKTKANWKQTELCSMCIVYRYNASTDSSIVQSFEESMKMLNYQPVHCKRVSSIQFALSLCLLLSDWFTRDVHILKPESKIIFLCVHCCPLLEIHFNRSSQPERKSTRDRETDYTSNGAGIQFNDVNSLFIIDNMFQTLNRLQQPNC